MTERTLIIAPHPDDEVLGAGGLLLRRKAEGAVLGWVIVTCISEQDGWAAERVSARDAEIAAAAREIGFDDVFNLRLPTARLDELPMSTLVRLLGDVFKSFVPTEVLVPHRGDVHSDHRVVFDAVAACTKWFRYPSVRRVMSFEAASETEFGLSRETAFHPNFFVDIGDYLERKLELLKVYDSEIGEFPFPRSEKALRALAEWRGANSGCTAAEAFELLRERQ